MQPTPRKCLECNTDFTATMPRQYWCSPCAEKRKKVAFNRYRQSNKYKEGAKRRDSKYANSPRRVAYELAYRKRRRKEVGPPANEIRNMEARKARRLGLIERLGGSCRLCGYFKCMRSLHIHHIDESRKRSDKDFLNKSFTDWDNLTLLCSNCHFEVHAGVTHL